MMFWVWVLLGIGFFWLVTRNTRLDAWSRWVYGLFSGLGCWLAFGHGLLAGSLHGLHGLDLLHGLHRATRIATGNM